MIEDRRILFIAPAAYPLGGIATWLDYLLPGLEGHGWVPTLGLVEGKFHDPDRYLDDHPYQRVVRIQNPTGSQEGRVRALCKAILSVKPALVLSVNIPDAYLSLARLRRQRKSSAKSVMTLHGIQSDLLGDAYAFRDVLDAVICTNRLSCQLVKEKAGIEEELIHYAPYGVKIAPKNRRSMHYDGDSSIRIVWVGRLDEDQKRVSDIPRILRELDKLRQPYELKIVGSGPAEGQLRAQLTPWLQNGRAILLGKLPHADVFKKIYSRADVFLLTSSWETGPIVIWEAMSAGLPVVTSEYVGCGPEGSLVHGKNCLMYGIGDAIGAAKCIAALIACEKRESLRTGGKELVRKRYSKEVSVTNWNSVLNDIVHHKALSNSITESNIESRGLLDRWLGVRAAETIRRMLGRRFIHSGPGGEWPHSLSQLGANGMIDLNGILASSSRYSQNRKN